MLARTDHFANKHMPVEVGLRARRLFSTRLRTTVDLMSLPHVLPTAADVDAAAQRLKGIALRTPLVTSPVLDALTGARVFLKAETLQRTGSFKFRGAYNKLASIPEDKRTGGVVAFSSGNHAQGVAAAA